MYQSVAVRLICERELAIKSFVPDEYWSLTAEFTTLHEDKFLAKLAKVAGNEPRVPDETTAKGYVADIEKQQFQISNVIRKPVKRNPPAPFITSTLQQEAARRLRMSTKRTMMLAQKLYEGQEIGEEGLVGLITYMRTDSTRLSEEAVAHVREYILNNYGYQYVPKSRGFLKKENLHRMHTKPFVRRPLNILPKQ